MRLSLVIIVVACGLAILAPAAYALCEPSTEQQQIARADVILEGTALEDPTETGIQRFHVGRYLKGNGPEIVNVWTGWVPFRSDGFWGVAPGIQLHLIKGGEYRIFATGSSYDVISTIRCDGSRSLPAPPLVIEPPPPPPEPAPEPVVAAPPPPPPADDPNGSLIVAAGVLKSVVATTALKTSPARPKAKRPRAAKRSKKSPQRAFRASSRLRRR